MKRRETRAAYLHLLIAASQSFPAIRSDHRLDLPSSLGAMKSHGIAGGPKPITSRRNYHPLVSYGKNIYIYVGMLMNEAFKRDRSDAA